MCNAGLGDSWSLYSFPDGSHFTATVSAISFDTICGSLPDSVKSISILHLDSIGTVIPDSLNNFRFRLSKSFGLITGLNVKHFPLRQWIYQLAGIDSIIGQQPITEILS